MLLMDVTYTSPLFMGPVLLTSPKDKTQLHLTHPFLRGTVLKLSLICWSFKVKGVRYRGFLRETHFVFSFLWWMKYIKISIIRTGLTSFSAGQFQMFVICDHDSFGHQVLSFCEWQDRDLLNDVSYVWTPRKSTLLYC